MALLQTLDAAHKPIKPQDIAPQLNADTATVYRSLNALVDAGLVRRIDLDEAAKYYELDRGDDHHHLVCTNCQAIEDVDTCGVEDLTVHALKGSDFARIDRHNLEFFGLCNACHSEPSEGSNK